MRDPSSALHIYMLALIMSFRLFCLWTCREWLVDY